MSKSPSRAKLLSAVLGTGALVLSLQPADAQTLEGVLLEGGTAVPIADGLIGLHTVEGVTVGQAETDSTGAFSIEATAPGWYFMTAEKLGYLDLTHGDFELVDGASVSFEVYLRPAPVDLDGVEATVDRPDIIAMRQRLLLERHRFFERQEIGFGDFFTPEMIQERQPTYFSDIIVRLPGVQIDSGILKFRGSRGLCEPNIWIDGVVVMGGDGSSRGSWGGTNEELRKIDDRIAATEVMAVEVYRTVAGTPLQYSIPNATCGTVLIWTG